MKDLKDRLKPLKEELENLRFSYINSPWGMGKTYRKKIKDKEDEIEEIEDE